MKSPTSSLVFLLLTLFIEATTASCGHGTSLLRRKVETNIIVAGEKGTVRNETVKTVELGKFGYIGSQGPTNWQGLSAENALCASSTRQSPIDVTNISTALVPPGELKITLPNVQAAEFENIGTTIEVVMEGKGGKAVVGGKEFELKQFHFHSPSEHTVNGEYFPLEMHMVHESADGQIAVIAAQFQLTEKGETTPLLTSVTEKIGAISQPGTITETGALEFSGLVKAIEGQALHFYAGSLTTPPCAEGLQFFITSQQLPLNVATFNKIKAVVGFNARFPQNSIGEGNLLAVAEAACANVANAAANAVNAANGGKNETGTGSGVVIVSLQSGGTTTALAKETGIAALLAAGNRASAVSVEGAKETVVKVGSLREANEIVQSLTGVDLGALGLKKE